MTRPITILCALAVCLSTHAAKLPAGAKLAWLLTQPAAAVGPSLTFATVPPGSFTLLASASLSQPISTWTAAASSVGSAPLTLQLSAFSSITNRTTYAQPVAWELVTNAISGLHGYCWNSNSCQRLVLGRRATGCTFSGLANAAYTFATTTYDGAGHESPLSARVVATPPATVSQRTLFFCAKTTGPTLLKLTLNP